MRTVLQEAILNHFANVQVVGQQAFGEVEVGLDLNQFEQPAEPEPESVLPAVFGSSTLMSSRSLFSSTACWLILLKKGGDRVLACLVVLGEPDKRRQSDTTSRDHGPSAHIKMCHVAVQTGCRRQLRPQVTHEQAQCASQYARGWELALAFQLAKYGLVLSR